MRKIVLRGIVARKLRSALTASAILLGVAMIVGTFVYADTINKAFFQIFSDAAKGADVVVSGKQTNTGNSFNNSMPPSVSESLESKISKLPDVQKVAGQVSDLAAIVGKDGKIAKNGNAPTFALSYMGPPFASIKVIEGNPPVTSDEVAIDKGTAEKQGYEIGDEVSVATDAPAQKFKLTGFVQFGGSSSGGATYVVFDLATAQRLYDKKGKVDYISVAAKKGVKPAALATQIQKLLPKDNQVKTSSQQVEDQTSQLRDRLSVITIGLPVFGFIAVFVGAFIIFNTFSITVTQRRREFALLRTMGASRWQICKSVIIEALVIGVIASALGIGLGLVFSELIAALLRVFKIDLPSTGLVLESRTVVLALTVGVLVTLLSAIIPALRATRVAPLEAMREVGPSSGKKRIYIRIFAAVVCLAGIFGVASGLTAKGVGGTERLFLSVGGVIILVFGVAMLSPLLVPPAARVAGWPIELVTKLTGRLARENAQRNPSRTAVTSAALMIGLSLVVFVTIFANGLKASADKVIDESLAGDLTVFSQNGFTPIPAGVATAVAKVKGVASSVPFKLDSSKVSKVGSINANGIDPQAIARVYHFDWIKGSDATLSQLGTSGVLVEEQMAEKGKLKVGDVIDVKTPTGQSAHLTVRGIYKDAQVIPGYAIPLAEFNKIFNQPRLASVLVKFDEGVNDKTTQKAVERALKPFPEAVVRSQAEVKENSAQQVDKILQLFYALLAMSLIVSLFGIVNTLTLSVFERTRELGLLRAVGMTKAQVWKMVTYESVITAAIGAALGLVLGTFFAAVVTQALGDQGLIFQMPWLRIVILLVLALLAGVVAAIVPARRASKLDVLKAISYE